MDTPTAFNPAIFFPLVTTHDSAHVILSFVVASAYAYLRAYDFEHLDVLSAALAASGVTALRFLSDHELNQDAIAAFFPTDELALLWNDGGFCSGNI